MGHKSQLLSGARGIIKFTDSDGAVKVLGFCTDVNVNRRAGLRPQFVVGHDHPVSIEPLSIDVDVSIGRVIPMNKAEDKTTLVEGKTTLVSTTGLTTAIDNGFEQVISEIQTSDSVEIHLFDNPGNDPEKERAVAAVRGCRFAGRTNNLGAVDLANERLNFTGIYDSDVGDSPDELNYGFEKAVE